MFLSADYYNDTPPFSLLHNPIPAPPLTIEDRIDQYLRTILATKIRRLQYPRILNTFIFLP